MRFNPAFIQLAGSIEEANDFRTSVDNANPFRSWLKLCPNEVYNQYIILKDDLKPILEFRNIVGLELWTLDGRMLTNNVGFGFKKYIDQNVLLLSFKLVEDYGNECLYLKIKLNPSFQIDLDASVDSLVSNIFSCSEDNRERTSIFTYKHGSEHYDIPYNTSGLSTQQSTMRSAAPQLNLFNQIRLPVFFKNWKTEQDSSEMHYDVDTPSNINISRVKRRFIKNWETWASDFINNRLAIISDSDKVYINGQREITRPYKYEETDGGSDFSISYLETQPLLGDKYMDINGLVNHKPVILNISYPNGSCCDPSDDPIIEPTIISQTTLSDTCQFQGIRKQITINGQPGAIIKFRLTASQLQGLTKQIQITGSNLNATFNFNSTSQAFVGFFSLNSSGEAVLTLKCCFEDCTPGNPISLNANFELYKMDGTTLSGQIANLTGSKACPLPATPKWRINSQNGTDVKNVSITGTPSTNATFVVRVLSAVTGGHYFPFNSVITGSLLNASDVRTDDQWEFTVPIASNGESAAFNISAEAGSYMGLMPPEASIYISLTLKNYNGTLSNEVVGIFDINQRP